ncbi:two-component system response regulator [Pseudoalteromonas luteoviolacea]|uniref:Two-component system response regulator n=1 Tax=Pseudoalteromonas luteoviolacea TaxID=43657 RepID=A0A1C0TTL4_9GAMM|nr:response regulator [Pseudoalteromonas luteoviolacea]OCQ22662.1 two-component system response regulator [Pseudoalteromonas luteoviolacea]
MNIVIIEDESAIADTLIHVLEMDGFQALWFNTAGAGLAHLENESADLLILDVGLPDGNGFELCKQIRGFSSIPIIFLTARADEIDRVVGLEIGADDYVTKPFSPREMLARVKLRLKSTRRQVEPCNAQEQDTLRVENFDYIRGNVALGLTALEFRLLDALLKSSPRVLSRQQLMDFSNMPSEEAYERNVDSHIKSIRSKLQKIELAECLKTKRGFGYYFEKDRM